MLLQREQRQKILKDKRNGPSGAVIPGDLHVPVNSAAVHS